MTLIGLIITAWKVSKYGFFLVRIFPYSTWIRRFTCSNTEFFLVRIFRYSNWRRKKTEQKKLRIWTPFTQWIFLLSQIQKFVYFFLPKKGRKYIAHSLLSTSYLFPFMLFLAFSGISSVLLLFPLLLRNSCTMVVLFVAVTVASDICT